MLELDGSGAEPLKDGDPRWIGPIPLIGRLGSGGMGRVYLGVHEGRYAAVKQLLPSVVAEDEDFLRRFGHELDNLARLPEEATAPLLDGDREARPPWFATAYVPGLTLTEALEVHGGPLPAGALWLLLREAAKGLAAVHALGMVHRDLKPSNVMLTLEGLTLIDFGVARAAEQSRLTRTGMVVGTPAYMSPEQASGRRASSGAVDVFALGSVLAYAASGRPPFGDESGHAVLYRIVHEEPDLGPLRELDPELAEVVASCLDKDHEGRPTAAELLETAERHGPYEPPLWPAALTERLTERAAFVTKLPEQADLPEPERSDPDSAPGSAVIGRRDPGRSERRRRHRVLVAVVPVVVAAGATLAVQLLPYTFAPDERADASPSSPAPVSSAPAVSPAGPEKASRTATPDQSASPSRSTGEQDDRRGDADGGSGAAGGSPGVADAGGAGAGSGSGSGSGSSDDGGAGTGSSDGSGSGSGSGSHGSDSDSGSGSGSGDGDASGSGVFMLKNAKNGRCMTTAHSDAPYDGDCTGDAATWTFRSRPGGTVWIINGLSGQCIYTAAIGHPVFSFPCGRTTGQEWRVGSGGTLQNVATGGCVTVSAMSGTGVRNEACDQSAAQRWTRS
ncbi:protein kinase [Streptomyces sp. ICN988]|uniref:serine/threonine-protein kinase n=1 Tax=Streptomyces sp. ICN988 TaxID=2983765 RepID=UPI0021E50CD1|nr:serine/threonine-protein kinase [Streptomyces sp. ICN988]MCV2464617.1 protein kinase [Streptomyces sp. ICN988]